MIHRGVMGANGFTGSVKAAFIFTFCTASGCETGRRT